VSQQKEFNCDQRSSANALARIIHEQQQGEKFLTEITELGKRDHGGITGFLCALCDSAVRGSPGEEAP
jgi:hypothetical protein